MSEEEKILLRELSSFFENNHHLPPLTSKIYAYLMISTRDDVTFDELTTIFNVSKSSVSNSLNFLIRLKYINYYTKIDSRKRYYRIEEGFVWLRLQKVLEMLTQEKQLISKLSKYKEKHIQDYLKNQSELADIYLNHLENITQQLSVTIDKLKNLTPNNKI